MLHDHHPECISPVPSVILDDSVGVNLDPEVEGDKRPAKDPSEDVHHDRVIGGEIEVGPCEQRVCNE
jgi:hypothetical protein